MGGIVMKSLEERAHDFAKKVYINGQEWWEDSSSIIALGESCYIKGAKDQIEKDCEWLTQLFDRDDYGLGVNTEKVVSQFRKAMGLNYEKDN